jgi:hypothetical protein
MKKTRKKMTLNRETLRLLAGSSLKDAAGGTSNIIEPSAYSYCLNCGAGGGSGVPTHGEATCGTQEHTACTTHAE